MVNYVHVPRVNVHWASSAIWLSRPHVCGLSHPQTQEDCILATLSKSKSPGENKGFSRASQHILD